MGLSDWINKIKSKLNIRLKSDIEEDLALAKKREMAAELRIEQIQTELKTTCPIAEELEYRNRMDNSQKEVSEYMARYNEARRKRDMSQARLYYNKYRNAQSKYNVALREYNIFRARCNQIKNDLVSAQAEHSAAQKKRIQYENELSNYLFPI